MLRLDLHTEQNHVKCRTKWNIFMFGIGLMSTIASIKEPSGRITNKQPQRGIFSKKLPWRKLHVTGVDINYTK